MRRKKVRERGGEGNIPSLKLSPHSSSSSGPSSSFAFL